MVVNNDSANLGKPNVFPWMAADGNGHVGIAWFGGDRAGDSNNPAIHAPCVSGSSTCMSGWTNWNVYYAETVNGHDAQPVFAQSVINGSLCGRPTDSADGGPGAGIGRGRQQLCIHSQVEPGEWRANFQRRSTNF
jgi:hypothetical protein